MPTVEHYTLKRALGVWSAAAIVVGTVIGSGIFLVPKAMIQNVGTPGMVFVVWIFGGLLSLFGALSYGELSAAMPEAGGEYVYLREAYGPFWGYIYGWTQMWVAKSGSIATLATGFFLYLANFQPALERVWIIVPLPIGDGGKPLEIRYGQLLAMAVIGLLALLNYFGVKIGGDVQVAVTIIKVGLIVAIIVIGLGSGQGTLANFNTSLPAAGGWAGFFAALVAALWAYDGWNNVSMVGSEIKNPQRNLPLALILGTLAVITIYLLTNLAYFYVLPASAVGSTDRVAGEMMRRILGGFGANGVSIAAMISIFAALNGSILSGSRVPFAIARDGLFFRSVAHIHPVHRTPSVSILLLNAWAAVLVLSGRYDDLFNYVIFASAILYAMATASVIVLRYKRPDLVRPYRTIGYPFVPIFFILGISCMIVSTLINRPRESLMGLALIALGIPFYLYWRRNADLTSHRNISGHQY
ncbi:MAG TPA: amino acid permease [Bryobacteraceae bacterium]|nr:amino acid permease [Bryobacteraceae bacterium]